MAAGGSVERIAGNGGRHPLPAAGGRATPEGGTVRVAAIDIGSNSIRQIVADVSDNGSIRVVDELKAQPRLGTGLGETGAMRAESMRSGLDALTRMATLARQFGASRIEAVATSAVRDASNGQEFMDLVNRETGLRIRALDGEDEARLAFRSALAHFDLGVGRWVVMDIGGGSVELALSADGLLDRLRSLPLGAIRMTEQYLQTAQQMEGAGARHAMRRGVDRLRRAVREALRTELPVREWRGAQVIGSGGTFTNLAGMYLSRKQIATARTVHGTHVPREDLVHILDALQDMTLPERMNVPGLNPQRADIIVAGLAVVAEVLDRVDARDVVVSGYGIREGVLLEAARVLPTVADPGEARARSVRELGERSHFDAPHAEHVRTLSLQLFDAIGDRLGLRAPDREALADAALLHDIGYHINYHKHHKHSYHLILHAELLGISPEEQVIVANVARYHRGTEPGKKHPNYGTLDKAMRRRIKRLAAILRVADGFDRGHAGAVARLRVRWLGRAMRITAVPATPEVSVRLELWGAARKAGLLAKVAGVAVEVVAPDGSVITPDDEIGDIE
jgi:exopolyphosphatase/guanosine-5'-triphosphate,3'-diphosphate pyrophosphatase